MAHSTPENSYAHTIASLIQSFTLLATATTAARVVRAIHDRRLGSDPSDETPPQQARLALAADSRALKETLYPLFVTLAADRRRDEGPDVVRMTRQFDRLQRLSDAVMLLHRVHQHLMSLFPHVPEQIVEEARILHLDAYSMLQEEGDGPRSDLLPVVERALVFADHVAKAARAIPPA